MSLIVGMQYCSRKRALFKGFGSMQIRMRPSGLATTRSAEIHGLGSLTDSMTPRSSSRRSSAPTLSRTLSGSLRHLNRRHLLVDLKMDVPLQVAQTVEQISKFGHYCFLREVLVPESQRTNVRFVHR